jgi:hypothetical protein
VTVTADPIVALRSLWYTEREAAFLYLVAVHSGYFLRRQFDYFTDRNKGALVMRFLEKARSAGHIESLDYRQGWHVYHLCSRSIYRPLGDGESQLRRRKGDAQVRARLMALDYVLENADDHYFESEQDRVRFFTEVRGIPSSLFTDGNGHLFALLACSPISLADRTRPALSTMRFTFIDEGLATIAKFQRFLACTNPLLCAVGNFELLYISRSEFNFTAAKNAFWNRFSTPTSRSLRLFDGEARSVAVQPRVVLQPRFTTVLLEASYPRMRRSEARSSTEGSHASK